MDVFRALQQGVSPEPIVTVGMHTTGEPTRIVLSGFGELLKGDTLLEKRAYAKSDLDHLRRRIMWEPRGHKDMYGAILVTETELTRTGEADLGVLFCHNEGYSSMCGHASLALGRFLVDTKDEKNFPRRQHLKHDPTIQTTTINLHAPCGLVRISVPTLVKNGAIVYDSSRNVSFLSVPCFTTALGARLSIPQEERWAGCPEEIDYDVSYGGAFYAIVTIQQLGFDSLRSVSLDALNSATRTLKAVIQSTPALNAACTHPTEQDLSFLYGIVVVDDHPDADTETGVCFFADQALDRSPTGSAVGARIALAQSKSHLSLNQTKSYHSLVSLTSGAGQFVGRAVEEVSVLGGLAVGAKGWVVRTEGKAFYTDAGTFVAEEEDVGGKDGFVVGLPT